MLVLKAIWKVIGGILFGMLSTALCVALFIVGCLVIGFVLHWMGVLLATVLGAEAWAALCVNARGIIILILGVLCLVGVIAMLVLEIRDQYIIEKAKDARRKEGKE